MHGCNRDSIFLGGGGTGNRHWLCAQCSQQLIWDLPPALGPAAALDVNQQLDNGADVAPGSKKLPFCSLQEIRVIKLTLRSSGRRKQFYHTKSPTKLTLPSHTHPYRFNAVTVSQAPTCVCPDDLANTISVPQVAKR